MWDGHFCPPSKIKHDLKQKFGTTLEDRAKLNSRKTRKKNRESGFLTRFASDVANAELENHLARRGKICALFCFIVVENVVYEC
jgi:hypothetical protein